MRGSAAWFAAEYARLGEPPVDLVLASSFLPLAEFVGLVPSLARTPRVLYFHENQFAYPVREEFSGERDEHYGFTQLVSARAADRCAFNSRYGLETFLDGGRRLLARLPDAVPAGWIEGVEARSVVLPIPLDLPEVPEEALGDEPRGPGRARGPIVLWNHRWEHDKDPDTFFAALELLASRDVPFRLAVAGESFRASPAGFERMRPELGGRVVHWGRLESRPAYLDLLATVHLAVSTARQEFFGVAVLEAVHFGARAVVPDRLAYREHFGPEHRYGGDARSLADHLEPLCRDWSAGRIDLRASRGVPFLARTVLPAYRTLFEEVAAGRT